LQQAEGKSSDKIIASDRTVKGASHEKRTILSEKKKKGHFIKGGKGLERWEVGWPL